MAIQRINLTSSRNIGLDAARGIHPDMTPVHLVGFNRTVGINFETIWNDGGGIYVFPTVPINISVVSTSALDTMGVRIEGLDADYKPLVEIVTLNGLTPVVTVNQFFRINDSRITNGNNAGNISLTNNGIQYCFIEATYGFQQSTVYTVAAGCSFYLNKFTMTSGTIGVNKYGTLRFKEKFFNGPTYYFFETTFVTGNLVFDLQVPFRIPEKTDFSVECKSSSSENEFTVYINALLIDD